MSHLDGRLRIGIPIRLSGFRAVRFPHPMGMFPGMPMPGAARPQVNNSVGRWELGNWLKGLKGVGNSSAQRLGGPTISVVSSLRVGSYPSLVIILSVHISAAHVNLS